MQTIDEIKATSIRAIRPQQIEGVDRTAVVEGGALGDPIQKTEWIEQLKAMPDLREAKVEAARYAPTRSAQQLAELLLYEV